ncbi:MAG: carbamoyltransferase HypF, partial [Deltaproteobacteria bacterium]
AVVAASVRAALSVARERGIGTVAASGGVLMNRIVMAGIAESIRGTGLTFITHEKLPVNDGSVPLGQAVVGWANRGRAE